MQDVERRGIEAVLELTQKFDGVALEKGNLKVSEEEIRAAYSTVSAAQLAAMRDSLGRIKKFLLAQKKALKNIALSEGGGKTELRWLPLMRVGIYAPAGRAPLPSSVLMAAAPAQIAGCKEIILCTPPQKDGKASPAVLVAAAECGIEKIYKIGGAQAIASMAYGLDGLFGPVDIIAGPGNRYVMAAKAIAQMKGLAAVDTIAGPSEVLFLADESANAKYAAADMLAQIEHGGDSSAVLITTSRRFASAVGKELRLQLQKFRNGQAMADVLKKNCALVVAGSLDEAVEIANAYAPEHLEVYVRKPERVVGRLVNAGAVFVNTGEVFGDYGFTGANHILPTGGSARFRSGVSVLTFMRYVYVEQLGAKAQAGLAGRAAEFANLEGLEAHANSALVRLEK